MPSKSLSQQRLFCMAYAVRKGKLKRNEVTQSVLDIADGDMTDKELKEFMVRECHKLQDYISESLYDTRYSDNSIEINVGPESKELFLVIKPGFLELSKDIIEMLEDKGFKLKRNRTKKLMKNEAEKMYKKHKKEDFYKALVEYMCSGLSMGVIVEYDDRYKTDKAAIKALNALKDEIREKWSESDLRNVMHSSDTKEDIANEKTTYFAQ